MVRTWRTENDLRGRVALQARIRLYRGYRSTGNSRVVNVKDWMPSTKGMECVQSWAHLRSSIIRSSLVSTISRGNRFWSVPWALTMWLWKLRKLDALAKNLSVAQAQGA